MVTVYLGLGTNLGDKENNLRQAIQWINKRIGKISSLSAFYASEPWGFVSENTFLNAAVAVQTSFSAHEVLSLTQKIEKELGRTHKSIDGVYSDRLIDIDLLLYGNEVITDLDLSVPHPLMTRRLFVMEPLADIAPDFIHPILRKTMRELCESLKAEC